MIGPLGHELFPERRRRTPVAVRERPRRCPVSIGCDARIGSDWDATSTAAASSRVVALELQLESEIVFGQSAAVQTLQTLQTALIVVIFGHISPLPVRCCSCHRPKQSRRAVLGSGAVSVPVLFPAKEPQTDATPSRPWFRQAEMQFLCLAILCRSSFQVRLRFLDAPVDGRENQGLAIRDVGFSAQMGSGSFPR